MWVFIRIRFIANVRGNKRNSLDKISLYTKKDTVTNDWTETVIRQWQTEDIELNPGISVDELAHAEKILDFVFPDQFRELYLKVNGFHNNDWRANMFSLWPVDRIIEEYNSRADKNFIGFSDYLINIHQIGFVKDRKGVYKYLDRPEFIANTFEEGIHLINIDSELIYV